MNDREKVLKIIVAQTEAHINNGISKVDVPHMARLSELTEGQIRPILRKAYFNYDLDSPAIDLFYKCTLKTSLGILNSALNTESLSIT